MMFMITFVLLSLASFSYSSPIEKRGTSGPVTFYGPPFERGPFGVGACGNDPVNHDYFVALGASVYDPSRCGQCVSVSYNGRTTVGPVADRCEACGTGIDISHHMMEELGEVNTGRIYSSWDYVPCPAGRGAPGGYYASYAASSYSVVGSVPS